MTSRAVAGQVAVVTIAGGRHGHLRQQRLGLSRSSLLPQLHVVVPLDDPDLSTVLADGPDEPRFVVGSPQHGGHLALAAARNHGAHLALSAGAEVLIFLDVDCIPGPDLVERYVEVVTAAPEAGLFSGPVAYLPPPPPGGYELESLVHQAPGHPARPVPAEDEVITGADHRLFWSLSFALSAATWRELGGFCEDYDGYGAEDTDFAQLAAGLGIGHTWVGGAWAYHQHHPTSNPPVQHLHDILRNANTFQTRWGWWPMQGWLNGFRERGLARFDPAEEIWKPVAG